MNYRFGENSNLSVEFRFGVEVLAAPYDSAGFCTGLDFSKGSFFFLREVV